MVAEQRQMLGPVGRGAILAFQKLADPSMKLHASLQQEIMVDDVMHQRLAESIARRYSGIGAAQFLDDIGVAEVIQCSIDAGRIGGDGAQERGIELRSHHRRLLRRPPYLLRQTIDAGKQQRLQIDRDIDIHVFGRNMPVLTVMMQRANVDQSPKDFLDEKRISTGPLKDALSHRDRQLSVSLAEKRGKQLLPVGCHERTKALHGDADTIGIQRVGLRCRPVDIANISQLHSR